jgi:hypothetical protein
VVAICLSSSTLLVVSLSSSGYDSVIGPRDVKATWPHLDGFEDRMTEVAGPTCDTPGVV